MISEGSCDTEDWSNDAENTAAHNSNKLHLVTFYFNVSLLQCNDTFKYWVIFVNYMYFLYG